MKLCNFLKNTYKFKILYKQKKNVFFHRHLIFFSVIESKNHRLSKCGCTNVVETKLFFVPILKTSMFKASFCLNFCFKDTSDYNTCLKIRYVLIVLYIEFSQLN